MGVCDYYWGSHGCSLPSGHDETVHHCGTDEDGHCSEYAEGSGHVRFNGADDDEPVDWSEWEPAGYGFRMPPAAWEK